MLLLFIGCYPFLLLFLLLLLLLLLLFIYFFILFILFFLLDLKKLALFPEDALIDNLILLLNLFRFRVQLCNFKYTRVAFK